VAQVTGHRTQAALVDGKAIFKLGVSLQWIQNGWNGRTVAVYLLSSGLDGNPGKLSKTRLIETVFLTYYLHVTFLSMAIICANPLVYFSLIQRSTS
jgi:hypothetical protein